jgi:hypothetical protein
MLITQRSLLKVYKKLKTNITVDSAKYDDKIKRIWNFVFKKRIRKIMVNGTNALLFYKR